MKWWKPWVTILGVLGFTCSLPAAFYPCAAAPVTFSDIGIQNAVQMLRNLETERKNLLKRGASFDKDRARIIAHRQQYYTMQCLQKYLSAVINSSSQVLSIYEIQRYWACNGELPASVTNQYPSCLRKIEHFPCVRIVEASIIKHAVPGRERVD